MTSDWTISGATDEARAPSGGEDPGMAVKMTGASFAGITDLAAGRRIDETELLALCDFVDARIDCADFRMITLLKVRYEWADLLSSATLARIDASILGFRYWMDEPGEDSMCYWSENHQCLFAVCEYLAGNLFPDRVFGNLGVNGLRRRERGAARLRVWLADRFRFGFTEWLSNTYYEEDIAPLALLIDHAPDESLRTEATMVLDLLHLDLALHRFGGRFVGSAGRCYEAQKQDPATADVNDILRDAFGGPGEPDPTRISAAYTFRSRYRVPEVIAAIAAEVGNLQVRASHGLDLAEVATAVGGDRVRRGLFFWLMEAFTTPESIDDTMALFDRWRLRSNSFLAPLAPFAPLRRTGLLPALVRLLNPATQGVAIQRANVLTTRTRGWLLSAAQRYQPRKFGDQQHLWQATLPGDVTVFANHPGAPMFDDTARGFSPAYWVGNGINPDVVADGNALLAVHDLRVRGGYLESTRPLFSHLWFPTERFDEVLRGPDWICGRAGDSLIGVRAARPLVEQPPSAERGTSRSHDFIQSGELTGWAVLCSETGESGSLAEFARGIAASPLLIAGDLASWRLPIGPAARGRTTLSLRRDGPALVDGQPIETEYPRLDSRFATVAREPEQIEISHAGKGLRLDWTNRRREAW
ncbi:hypothetical protein CGZ95_09430 [Enemella evansiae]|uniref:hypothetical protein n=1 Tax=Enemella evansiae TaxID=2016499 RepID=UPI000B95EE59|nr:hypothetical protein [Enemella evansiae]OYO00826.1 hypothetical protein CGZ95_09430 [Enemella evansiae]